MHQKSDARRLEPYGTAKRPQAHLERRNTHLSWVKVRGRVRRARIPRVRILFMLYLFEFFELNNLHVAMAMVIYRNVNSVCTAMSAHEFLR